MGFVIYKFPRDRGSSHTMREAAVDGVRELFAAGLAQRGEFYVVERDDEGNVVGVFDVDDEVEPATASRR